MPIAVLCPGCNSRLNAPDTAAGKTVKCPKCQAAMVIPAPDAEPEVEDTPPPKRSAAPPRKRSAEGDDDDRPRKKRKKAATSGPPVGLLIGGGLALLLLLAGGGFAAYWFGFRDKGTGGGGGAGGAGGGGIVGKAPVPAGWKEVSPPNSGFKAYFPAVEENAQHPTLMPSAAFKTAAITNYFGWSADRNTMCAVNVLVFPDDMPAAAREAAVIARMKAGVGGAQELGRGKSTLGGKEATEVVDELSMAGKLGPNPPKPAPGRTKPPEKVGGVTRYCVVGNRGYIAEISHADGRPPEAHERGFFDNFEFVKP